MLPVLTWILYTIALSTLGYTIHCNLFILKITFFEGKKDKQSWGILLSLSFTSTLLSVARRGLYLFMILTLESIFPFCVRTSVRNMKGNHVWDSACDFRTSACEPKGNLGLREHSERVSGCASVWRLHRGGQGDNLNDGGFMCGESSVGLTSAGGGWSTISLCSTFSYENSGWKNLKDYPDYFWHCWVKWLLDQP